MFRVFWLTMVLAVAPAVAGAQPAPAPTEAASPELPDPRVRAATDQAQTTSAGAELRVAKLAVQRTQLAQRYQEELAAIDRLKQQKSSWRRDRELRSSLSDSADTARQLQQVTRDFEAAQREVQAARAKLLSAIDGEIATGPSAPRAQALAKLRSQVAPQVGPAAKKIVIPDADIDPLADPEELEQQAAAIRVSEGELSRQVIGLDAQVKDLKSAHDLLQQHQRATDLALRDDDQPHRSTQPSTGGRSFGQDSAAPTTLGTPTNGGGAGSGAGGGAGAGTDTSTDHLPPMSPVTTFEAQLTVILGDVVDHTTIEGLLRASRSGDPAQRAEAAQKVREAVAARLEQLKRKRAAIENRAKSLRKR